jgi:hypothetical protein
LAGRERRAEETANFSGKRNSGGWNLRPASVKPNAAPLRRHHEKANGPGSPTEAALVRRRQTARKPRR